MDLILHMHAEAPFAFTCALQHRLQTDLKVTSQCSGSERVLRGHHMRRAHVIFNLMTQMSSEAHLTAYAILQSLQQLLQTAGLLMLNSSTFSTPAALWISVNRTWASVTCAHQATQHHCGTIPSYLTYDEVPRYHENFRS